MKKGGFMRDALILFAITLIAGFLLGGVYQITKEPIAIAEEAERQAKFKLTYPEAAQFVEDDALKAAVETAQSALVSDKPEYGNVHIVEALNAVDGSGTVIGHIVTASSDDSYGGTVKVSVGVTLEGAITGVELLTINDTPGLGMKAKEPAFKGQFTGKSVEEFTVVKTGSQSDSEIDAIGGATITSNAVTYAVDSALYFVHNYIGQGQ